MRGYHYGYGRNAADVIGYTYDADYHCVECAIARFGAHPDNPGWCAEGEPDAENPYPIFGDSEWWFDGPDAPARQLLTCGTCGHTIATLDADGDSYVR